MVGRRVESRRIGIAIAAVVSLLALGCADNDSPTGIVFAQDLGANVAEPAGIGMASEERLSALVAQALQGDRQAADVAFLELRNVGQPAVDYLMSRCVPPKAMGQANMPAPQPPVPSRGSTSLQDKTKLYELLDAVAQQKDAKYSGLFWYTDLDRALAVAKREKKPVLSLRLLGKLTDELSCANSRFFRTTLYPNSEVRKLLTQHYVLHWQWVRQAPIITIDFGDGRKIERTITGNSLHMVLDEQGRAIDVLPGLYAAGPFIRLLTEVAPVAVACGGMPNDEFQSERAKFHRDRLTATENWWNDVRLSKLRELPPPGHDYSLPIWDQIAALEIPEPAFDGEAQRAVVEHAPQAAVAGRLALGKSVTETPMLALVRNVSKVIKEDSVRNEYYLHFRIHQWFAEPIRRNKGPGFANPGEPQIGERDQLVRRIYDELFLSPLDDPWYGLSKPDVYSALKNDGRIDAVTQNTGH